MKVNVLKPIQVLGMGRLAKGQTVDLHPSVAQTYLAQGAVELYETKVLRENPIQPAGAPSSASPAGQVSPRPMSKPSGSGEAKARRAKKAKQ